MSWSSAASSSAGTTLGIVKYFIGNSKEKKARRALEKLKAPIYKIQDEYLQNKNMAAEAAQGGLPQATKDYYTQESQRGLSSGIKGILGSGGNPNDIQKIFSTYDDGLAKIGVADAAAHLDNIKYYMGVNKDLAGQKTTQWAINDYQPYLNKVKQLNAAQKAGEAIKASAYDDVMGSITSFGSSSIGGMGGAGSMGAGKSSGGGGGGGSASIIMNNGGGSDENFSNSFNRVFSSGNSNNYGTSGAQDPFGNDEAQWQKYLQWKRYNGG